MKLAAFSRNSNHYLGLVDDFNGVMKRLDIRDHSHESEGVVALIGTEMPDVVEEIALTDIQWLPPTLRPVEISSVSARITTIMRKSSHTLVLTARQ